MPELPDQRDSNPKDPLASVRDALARIFANPRLAALALLGLAGIVLSVVLVLLAVNVSGVSGATTCGSVMVPTENTFGAQATCGKALSSRAVESGGFLIGGIGFFFASLLPPSLCRAFLLMTVTIMAASLVGIFDGSGSALSGLAAFYSLAMGVVVGRRGLSRSL